MKTNKPYLNVPRLLMLAAGAALPAQAKSPAAISMAPIGSVAAGSFLTSAAEIAAYDPLGQRVFVVNAQAAQIDVIDISNPAAPVISEGLSIDVTPFGAVANSVAVHNGLVAVAVEAADKTQPGQVVFFDGNLQFVSVVEVGAQPDMLIFTPDGQAVLTANEGEPRPDYTSDPEGSVSIIDLSRGAALASVRTAGFEAFNGWSRESLFNGAGAVEAIRIFGEEFTIPLPTGEAEAKRAIRVFGPNPASTIAQDIEPEFITISQDSKTAWVTLQENNALAVIDITSARVKELRGLGVKDHGLASNGFDSSNALDASDRDGIPVANAGRINITNWPVKGFYLPDAITSFRIGNATYLILANEGDSRDWTAYSEETRVGSMALDPAVFPTAADLKKPFNLGRLKATTAQGFTLDPAGARVYQEIYTFGARSFSIRSATGALVWDSGDQIEQITAAQNPAFFNSNHEVNKFDDRSDDKGPEPEGVTVGKAFGRTYAFIGLERIGGVMIFDVSEPTAPEFVQYVNNRDFTQATNTPAAGDLGPEGLLFIAGEDSPNGQPLVVVSNEVSGTTTVYGISKVK